MARELNATAMIERTTVNADSVRKRFEQNMDWYSPKEKPRSFEDARHQVEMDLRYRQWDSLRPIWITELREKYNVKIHNRVVENIWTPIEPLPEIVAQERANLRKERKKQAEITRKESQIKMKLKPGTTQTFERDGKQYKVKIGQPKVRDKSKDGDNK